MNAAPFILAGFLIIRFCSLSADEKGEPLCAQEDAEIRLMAIQGSIGIIHEILPEIQSNADDPEKVQDLVCDAMKHVMNIKHALEIIDDN